MKTRLAVIFGSRTVEHDVSIVTGIQLMENIDTQKYDILPIYITRDGEWFTGEKLRDIEFVRAFDKNSKEVTKVFLPPVPGTGGLMTYPAAGGLFSKGGSRVIPFDVAIPAMHGLNGEDGTLQGLLELADVPYTSCGVLGSSTGMDKIVMKAAFKGAGIPVLDGEFFTRDEWAAQPDEVISRLEKAIEYPMIVKPANLGSSIGITRADNAAKLRYAIEVAVQYDRRIIVEHAIVDNFEINCSCLGYENDVTPSVCEQPVSRGDILDFGAKYLQGGKNAQGMQALSRLIPAPIPEELTQEVQRLSVEIFKALDCKGVVRIDYLYDKAAEKLYANEINTIPGSFAFYLWEPIGVGYAQLVDKLVEFALKAHADKNRSVYAYDSEILRKACSGAKGGKGAKGGRVGAKR